MKVRIWYSCLVVVADVDFVVVGKLASLSVAIHKTVAFAKWSCLPDEMSERSLQREVHSSIT